MTILIVDPKRWGVCDQNIQGTPVIHPIQQQARQHTECTEIGFVLSVLICPIWAVANASAKTGDQKFFVARQLEIQVGAAFDPRKMIFRIVSWVMVAGHVHQRLVQKGEDVLEIGIRQVAASQDQFYIAEMTALREGIQPLHDLVAHRKDFHKELLCLRKPVPAREKSLPFAGTIDCIDLTKTFLMLTNFRFFRHVCRERQTKALCTATTQIVRLS